MNDRTCRSCSNWRAEKRTRANGIEVLCYPKGGYTKLIDLKDCREACYEPGSDEDEFPDGERLV